MIVAGRRKAQLKEICPERGKEHLEGGKSGQSSKQAPVTGETSVGRQELEWELCPWSRGEGGMWDPTAWSRAETG